MAAIPEPIQKLINKFAELPSIGPRQATRLAFYLIGQGSDTINSLARNLDELKKIKICSRCFFVHRNENNLCSFCMDKARKQNVIAVVEKETDLLSIENTKKFNGRYFILGIIPKTGILDDWQKLRLQSLKTFIQKELSGKAEEIILAFNPTSNGDFNSTLITKELQPLTKKITRLGRGLPTGGEIEFADDETLGSALEQRR